MRRKSERDDRRAVSERARAIYCGEVVTLALKYAYAHKETSEHMCALFIGKGGRGLQFVYLCARSGVVNWVVMLIVRATERQSEMLITWREHMIGQSEMARSERENSYLIAFLIILFCKSYVE